MIHMGVTPAVPLADKRRISAFSACNLFCVVFMQSKTAIARRLVLTLVAATFIASSNLALADDHPLCLYVASYQLGNEWSDGIERGLRRKLQGNCTITEFYMDTKRYKSVTNMKAAGLAAYELIKDLKPDVVITSDDNAAKFLIVPHLVDTDTPVVFSGINWTVKEYGFPAANVTGIVEVAPTQPMLLAALRALKVEANQKVTIAYLGANTLTEQKNYDRVKATAETLNIQVDSILATHFSDWKTGFQKAQSYDMVIIGAVLGINDFDEKQAIQWANLHTLKLSMTDVVLTMPYAALGYTKIAEEQGEWAAAAAIAILSGIKAADIPLVTNRMWDTWINTKLLSKTGLRLDETFMINAKKFQ